MKQSIIFPKKDFQVPSQTHTVEVCPGTDTSLNWGREDSQMELPSMHAALWLRLLGLYWLHLSLSHSRPPFSRHKQSGFLGHIMLEPEWWQTPCCVTSALQQNVGDQKAVVKHLMALYWNNTEALSFGDPNDTKHSNLWWERYHIDLQTSQGHESRNSPFKHWTGAAKKRKTRQKVRKWCWTSAVSCMHTAHALEI